MTSLVYCVLLWVGGRTGTKGFRGPRPASEAFRKRTDNVQDPIPWKGGLSSAVN